MKLMQPKIHALFSEKRNLIKIKIIFKANNKIKLCNKSLKHLLL